MNKKDYPAFFSFKKAGENLCFIKNINDNTVNLIDLYEAELISSLSGSKTISEHLKTISAHETYGISYTALQKMLSRWIIKGFLREEDLLFNEKKKLRTQKNKNILSCCVTYNRPEMLDKWLRTRIRSSDYLKRKTTIIICDDTKKTEIQSQNRRIATHWGNKYPGKIIHFDRNKKKKLIKKINDILPDSIPKDLISFSISADNDDMNSKSTGSNRNALNLFTAGHTVYSSDDDLEYQIFSLKKNDNNNNLFSQSSEFRPLFTEDINSLFNITREEEKIDLLKHFDCFIDSEAASLKESQKYNALSEIPSETAYMIEKKDLKIQTVVAGYCGGKWYRNPYLPLLHRNINDRWLENPAEYNKVKANGINFNSSLSYIINNGDFFMGGTYCINNRIITPPCFPIGRREDTNFGIILNKCLASGFTMLLPYALFHNPVDKKPFTLEDFNDVSVDIGVYTTIILEKLTFMFINPCGEKRIKELGLRIMDFADLNISIFEEQLKLLQLNYISRTMNHISYLLEIYEEEPSWWADDIKSYYKLLKTEAEKGDSVVPRELRTIAAKEKALSIFKDYLNKCGEMLYWWPEIWNAAAELNKERKGILE